MTLNPELLKKTIEVACRYCQGNGRSFDSSHGSSSRCVCDDGTVKVPDPEAHARYWHEALLERRIVSIQFLEHWPIALTLDNGDIVKLQPGTNMRGKE